MGGENFDPAGLVLTAKYEDESAEDITVAASDKVTYDKEPLKTTTATDDTDETQNIVFTFGGKTVAQAITVKYNPVKELVIKTAPKNTTYLKGQVFDPTGLVLTATYKSEKVEDIDAAKNAEVIYNKKGLTADDTTIAVTYREKTVNVTLNIMKGIFVEAESGDIVSDTVDINTNSVRLATEEEIAAGRYKENDKGNKIATDENGNEINTASGGKYIGDLKTGDTVTFIFDSTGAGTINMQFRMASQYLKKDDSWAPIWIGDCQLNLIVKVYVNDVLCPIPDETVLPGGGSENGTVNRTLWYNWQDVPVENVGVKEGRNTIRMEFIAHKYTDTSQSSFSGRFTANIDSLIVDAGDTGLDFTPYALDVELPTEDVSGQQQYKHFDMSTVEVRESEGKAYLVIGKNTYSYTHTGNYTEEELAEKVESVLTNNIQTNYNFDLQANPNVVGTGYKTVLKNAGVAHVVSDTEYEMWVDLSALENRAYTTHFAPAYKGTGSGATDLKLQEAFDKVYGIGNKKYQLVSIPGSSSSAEYWGCLGVRVSELKITAYPTDLADETYAGLKVKLEDSAADTAELAEGAYTVTRDGETVTISYTETFGEGESQTSVTYTVSYPLAPVSIAIKSYPDAITSDDFTGLTVTATFINGTTADVAYSDAGVSVTEEDKIVTVDYRGAKLTYSKIPSLEITTYPTDIPGGAYTGLTAKATYVDGTEVADIALADLTTEKDDATGIVTVKYDGGQITYSTLPTLKITGIPEAGDVTDFTGLTVDATYVNGQKVTLSAEQLKEGITVGEDGVATIEYDGATAKYVATSTAPTANWVDDTFFTDGAWSVKDAYVKPTVDAENKKVTIAANSASRNESFFMVSQRDENGNVKEGGKVNLAHDTGTTESSGIFGIEHIWTMNVKASDEWGFMIFATNGVGINPSNSYSAYYIDYKKDGTFEIRGSGVSDGRIVAKSLLTDFSTSEVNEMTLSLTRENAGNIMFKLFINGRQVYFEATPNSNGGTVVGGNWRFASRGHGPRLNFVSRSNTTIELTRAEA